MRTLIIPCAGSRIVNGIPLYIQLHPDGELLVIKAFQGVFPEKYDRIIITILRSDNEKFNIKDLIQEKNCYRYPIEIIELNEKTAGPAETVFKTVELAHVSGEFAVRDSHAYIKLEKDIRGNFISSLDLTKYEKTIENLRSKSFITLNEQNQVLDVVEKHFCSDIISTGYYGFKNVEDFTMAFLRLKDPNYPFLKIYNSHIISYLIGYKQRVFTAGMVTEFEDWSTKSTWNTLQRIYSTCFINLDKVIYDEKGCINKEVITSLQALSDGGMRFIIYSSNLYNADEIRMQIEQYKINLLEVVVGCTHSTIKNIIDNKEDLDQLFWEV